ncbi:MAG: DUF3108 domain-containing protein [Candidatus Omnitrophica bacterium]|nr:DUF3108 domain-containing protein [Candidatus Omnitrophota bacterium]
MKKLVITPVIFFFWVFFFNPIFAQNFAGKQPVKITISEPQKYLPPEETIEYTIEWLGIPSGKIIFNIAGIIDYQGRQCYHLKLWATPNSFFARFYDVEYFVESFVDIEHFYPYYYKKTKRFRNNLSTETIEFDRSTNTAKTTVSGMTEAVINSPLKASIKEPRTSRISEKSLVSLSAVYFLRLQKINPGREMPFFVYQDFSNWQMSVIPSEPFLKDIRKNGSLKVIELTPLSSLTSFVFGKNKADIYMTADPRRIPVEFIVGTTIGSLRARIKKMPD